MKCLRCCLTTAALLAAGIGLPIAGQTNLEIHFRGTSTGPLLIGAIDSAKLDGAERETRIQHDRVGSDVPIARAIEISSGSNPVLHSGLTPRPINPDAPRFSREY